MSNRSPVKGAFKHHGWIPDLPDQRDLLYAAPAAALRKLLPRADLRSQCPPVFNQGTLGSCTANAIAAAIEFDQMKQKLADVFVPARLFIYYNERAIEGTVDFDSGAQLRDGIKSAAKQGVCRESTWPYDVARFKTRPARKCYQEALKHRVVLYQRLVPTLNQLRGCLTSGYPFLFGFTVYESFDSDKVSRTGQAPIPGPKERVLGGHAVLAVGYDNSKRRFLVRNSWGTSWGMKGYFTLPYGYVTNTDLAADFWTIRLV
jgi:C1A family cysteine protease